MWLSVGRFGLKIPFSPRCLLDRVIVSSMDTQEDGKLLCFA